MIPIFYRQTETQSNLAILLNENQGWEETNSLDLAFSPDGVAPIDLDGDEHKDLFAIEQGTGEHALLSNQGSDGFVVAQSGSLDTPVLESVLADGDFDGDQDLIYSDQSNLAWAKNDGSNGFIPQVPIESGIGEIASIEVGDFDNDGDHDIIYSQPNSGNVSLLSNQGEGIFDSQEIDSGATSIEDMQLADLDGDGDDDLLFASSQDSAIGWFVNNGSEGFEPGQTLAEGIDQVDQIKVADLDLDDDLDIVAASNQHDEEITGFKIPDPMVSFPTIRIVSHKIGIPIRKN